MTTLIVLVPFIFALVIARLYSLEKAFLAVYIPVLLLLPSIFVINFPPVPAWSFSDFAILPIFFIALVVRFTKWKYSHLDLLVLGYVACSVYSEAINEGPGYARHLFEAQLTTVIAPYLLAKSLINPGGLTVPFTKRLVFLMFINVLLTVYELRLTANPYINFIHPFFPADWVGWPTSTRYGIARISGPFIQTILFGTGLGIVLLLNYWLIKNRFWKSTFKYIPPLPIKKGMVITLVLMLGLLVTFSRGPQLSTLVGAMFITLGFSKHRVLSLFFRFCLLAIGCFMVYSWFEYYAGVDRFIASSDMQATAAYRYELITNYVDIAMQKPVWGWGSQKWPKESGLLSIDNEYLFLTMQHGLVTLGFLLAIMAYVLIGLLIRGIKNPSGVAADTSLCFTFFGIYLMMIMTFLTVYMGLQLEPLFFILTGWIGSYLQYKPKDFIASQKFAQYTHQKAPKEAVNLPAASKG